MEALMLVCDSVAIVLIVYMGLRDDRRPKGAPQTSLFRMREPEVPAARDDTGRA